MKLKIDGKQNNPILPRAVEPLLADADASDLRVLVYAALCDADGRDFEPKDAADALALARRGTLWRIETADRRGKAKRSDRTGRCRDR